MVKYWHTLLREVEVSIPRHTQNSRPSAAWSCWTCFEQEFGLDEPWRFKLFHELLAVDQISCRCIYQNFQNLQAKESYRIVG